MPIRLGSWSKVFAIDWQAGTIRPGKQGRLPYSGGAACPPVAQPPHQWRGPPRPRKRLTSHLALGFLINIRNRILYSGDLLRILIRNLDIEFFLKSHDQFNNV